MLYKLSSYFYCGLTVASDIAIPELRISNQNKVGIQFSLKSVQLQLPEHLFSYHWLTQNGEKMLSYGKQESYHWLHFPQLAFFRISANAKKISCYPMPEIPQETIRHLLLDQVLPRCLAFQGMLMLHASAVQLKQGILLFIGDSGMGKSTLAGNFHKAGQRAISDDCIRIKENKAQIKAVPSYGGLRLWEDSLQVLFASEQTVYSMAHYSTKKRVPLSENDLFSLESDIPILAVIVLSPPSNSLMKGVILERIPRREAFIALMKQSFHLNVMDLERIKCHMNTLGQIVPGLQSFRLSMPRDYDLLPLVRQKILETVL